MTREEYIALIRKTRLAKGLTQKQAGDASGVAQSNWALVEAGKKSLLPETMIRMGEAVGLDVSYRPEEFVVRRGKR